MFLFDIYNTNWHFMTSIWDRFMFISGIIKKLHSKCWLSWCCSNQSGGSISWFTGLLLRLTYTRSSRDSYMNNPASIRWVNQFVAATPFPFFLVLKKSTKLEKIIDKIDGYLNKRRNWRDWQKSTNWNNSGRQNREKWKSTKTDKIDWVEKLTFQICLTFDARFLST